MTESRYAELLTEDAQQLEERLLAAVRDMADEIRERAVEAQQITHIHPAIHERFLELGLYRMYIPRAHGGLEVAPATFFKVVIEIARADVGTAWCFCLSANHALMVANWFPAAIHAEVYNSGDFRAASMYAPTVKATPVEGGYQLDGVVNYCSGIPYSTYFLGQARLPGLDAEGNPRIGLYLAPEGSYEILDDWGHMIGLNSSGSNSIRFTEAFLPERFMVEDANLIDYAFDADSPGYQAYGNSMYSARHNSSFALALGAICVGGAKGALDEYRHAMDTRRITVPPFSPRTEDPDFQRYYGGAIVKIATGEAALLHALDEWLVATEKNVSGEQSFTIAIDNLLGGIGREIMLQMWEVVEKDLYRTIGASASKKGERFELVFRDMAQAAGHRNPQLRDVAFRQIAQDALQGA
ncbi:acyl-CoA dehydrogenase family protein [Leucobacter allii]|uniref:Acyl-CoA dehydrogenase family protein n=1 Tax=Leucobacter allii TaxID=2932247 RepID=A0ABY4FKW5_9MICO|nr:acyl-CoA dehydrogenase family protein [Leucobacter allii]UOQ56901.1 acyl-CoA dehydrogenase family protein [Leucobacter allii]